MSTPNNEVYDRTPLAYSKVLSRKLGANVYLKLDNLQPSGSFKNRGVGHFCSQLHKRNPSAAVVIASGGNAALACSHVAAVLGMRCVVFLPAATHAAAAIIELLEADGAEVYSVGRNYNEALAASIEFADKTGAVSVPAYDNEDVMMGNSSLIAELKEQLAFGLGAAHRPAAIFCSVGGGGLLGGLLIGSRAHAWTDVDFVAVETVGSNCLLQSIDANLALPAGRQKTALVALEQITSKASSLGARTPAEATVKMALEQRVTCLTITDSMALEAARQFLDAERILTELGCSATLVPAFHPGLLAKVLPDLKADTNSPPSSYVRPDPQRASLIFIVCGGAKVSAKDLADGLDGVTYSEDVRITRTF